MNALVAWAAGLAILGAFLGVLRRGYRSQCACFWVSAVLFLPASVSLQSRLLVVALGALAAAGMVGCLCSLRTGVPQWTAPGSVWTPADRSRRSGRLTRWLRRLFAGRLGAHGTGKAHIGIRSRRYDPWSPKR